MKPSNLSKLLAQTIPSGMPVLITGMPGIGKSDITYQATQACDSDLIISHPAVADPTDAKGFPWVVNGKADFLPFGELRKAIDATKLTTWLLDDIGQATPAVQASYMQLLLARRVNGHKLPDCVTFIACTNRRSDRAGVSGILEPVKSRFSAIVELTPDIDDWSNWAINHGIQHTLIAFLRFRPDLLAAFSPTQDMTNSPCPRTWASLAKIESLNLPAAIEAEAMAGAVGAGAATEYLAFRKLAAALVSVDQILLDPIGSPIPTKPAELYAISSALAVKANDKNLGRIAQYAERMTKQAKGEFAALTLRDAVKRQPMLTHTDAFIKLVSGPLGSLISGGEL